MRGRRFTRLVALYRCGTSSDGNALWMCRCDCGMEKPIRVRSLLRDITKSCGCLKRELSAAKIRHITAESAAEWRGLLDSLCEVVTRHPQRPRELLAALCAQWGECGDRRFRRALSTLVKQGRVVRSGKYQSVADENASVYALPPVPWATNLGSCLAEAAATYAVYELGIRRAA